jgi:hypothetical protein
MATREQRAQKMVKLADELCDREGRRAEVEGILEAQDLVSVFASAAAMSVIRLKVLDEGFASQMAASALRTIINNLTANGVEIADL